MANHCSQQQSEKCELTPGDRVKICNLGIFEGVILRRGDRYDWLVQVDLPEGSALQNPAEFNSNVLQRIGEMMPGEGLS